MADILCTGGAGFIGSHVVDRLIDNNHNVTVIDNLYTGIFKNINKKAHFIKANIRDLIELETKTKSSRFDYIFHLAAQINLRESIKTPAFDAQNNIIGTLNVIHLSKLLGKDGKNAKIIFASTGGAIYSPKEKLPWSEFSKAKPESPYGVAKLSSEHYLRVLSPNSVSLRLSNVYGPRQNPKGEAGVIAIFLDKMLKNEPITIYGDGFQTRDFVYVDDVVDAFMISMNSYVKGVYNVGTSERTDVDTIAKQLMKLIPGDRATIKYEPEIPGELKHSSLSYHKIMASHGWRPKTSLYDGLKSTIDYYI